MNTGSNAFTTAYWRFTFQAILILSIVASATAQQLKTPAVNPPALKGVAISKDAPKPMKVLAQYSHGDPTAEEQYTLELMNRARSNPKAEGARLVNNPDPDVQSSFTYFNVAKTLVVNQFNTYPSRPPLAFNEKLIKAARDHSQDMKDNDFQGHSGSNGSQLSNRTDKAGYTGWSNIGENVFSYAKSLWHAHAGFNVDFGTENQAQLGHRENIMNFGNFVYTEVGVGIKQDDIPGTQVGKYIVTHDFGRRSDIYVLGVAYKDNNNNGFYDVGEGIPNIKIELSKGSYFAVTSTSGGYAIPVTGLTGSITVTATGAGLGGDVRKNVTLSGENVKVDITSALPGMVVLSNPADDATETVKDITFNWYKSTGTTLYNFVLADNQAMENPILDIETTDTSKAVFGTLKNNQAYYWKVRAKTQAGWGDFSEVNNFEIMIYPKDCEIIYPKEFEAIYRDTVTLRWKKTDPTAERYWIQLSGNEYFEEVLMEDSTLTDTSKFVNIDYDMTYYWRVRSRNGELWNEFSNPEIFYSVQVPAGIALVAPVNGFTTSNKNIRFTWKKDGMDTEELKNNPFLPKGLFYWFEIAEDEQFTKMFLLDSLKRDTTIFVGNLKSGKNYYWHVKAYHEMGYGPFGSTYSISISDPSSVDEDLQSLGLHYAVSDQGIVFTANAQQSDITISAYTIDGKKISSQNDNTTYLIPCTKQSAIMYVHVQSGKHSSIIPIQCIR